MIGAGDHAAAAQHGHAVRRLLDLGELVRDQDHRGAACGNAPADIKQCGDLVRQQDCRRLVEHEQARLADQAFDDFDALPLADRKILDLGVRVERETVIIGQTFKPLRPGFCIHEAALLTEDDIVDHGHVVHQTEMLVHHGDAAGERVRRAGRAINCAAKAHGAFVRHVDAENQIAQGGFAGAVFAENAVHLARHDVERGVGYRQQGTEPLGDALQRPAAVRPEFAWDLSPRAIQEAALCRVSP